MSTSDIASPVHPSRGALRPLGLESVRITGGFWHHRQEVNADATFAHIIRQLELDGTLPNFDAAVRGDVGSIRRGRVFSDSDVYKLLEGLAWEIGRTGDPAMEAQFRLIVDRIRPAQEADGYLNTAFGRNGQPPRWSDLEWGHELYGLGHLFQAAVARMRTRPDADDGLLDMARRSADLICAVFGPDGRDGICGHAEVELGLAELGRTLREPRYVDQARLFVDRHGHGTLADIEWGAAYFQDEAPLRDAEALRGHAVRANYLAAAAVDVAVENDDHELLASLSRQWDRTMARRTYLTGGQGSHHQDEAFGDDWELPADRAYAETCAGIGSNMFSWRLLLATGETKYADLMERTLFNILATSPSNAGTEFFYSNTLHQRKAAGETASAAYSLAASGASRASWFDVSCCPPNVARTLAALASTLATIDDDGLQLHQFATSEVRTELADGRAIALDVETDYPLGGTVRVTVLAGHDDPWTLSIRVPSWATGSRATVQQGERIEESAAEPGTMTVRRTFAAGDVVELHLPMAPRWSEPDPRIDAVRGSVAVERGPLVLALESVDLGVDVATAVVDTRQPLIERDGQVIASVRLADYGAPAWPYGIESRATLSEPRKVPLVAYHGWGERGPSTMRIWIPRDAATQTTNRTEDIS